MIGQEDNNDSAAARWTTAPGDYSYADKTAAAVGGGGIKHRRSLGHHDEDDGRHDVLYSDDSSAKRLRLSSVPAAGVTSSSSDDSSANELLPNQGPKEAAHAEKRLARKLANRRSAKESRERRKALLSTLRSSVETLGVENDELERERAELEDRLRELGAPGNNETGSKTTDETDKIMKDACRAGEAAACSSSKLAVTAATYSLPSAAASLPSSSLQLPLTAALAANGASSCGGHAYQGSPAAAAMIGAPPIASASLPLNVAPALPQLEHALPLPRVAPAAFTPAAAPALPPAAAASNAGLPSDVDLLAAMLLKKRQAEAQVAAYRLLLQRQAAQQQQQQAQAQGQITEGAGVGGATNHFSPLG